MKYPLLFLLLAGFVLPGCNREDKFTTSGSDKLEFSLDTLRFDTVFTELGSATRFFRVYNRHKESIRISRIWLAGNQQSKFNLNVDGLPGDEHREVVIYPNDSIYVFAEVTINPDDPLSVSPFFVYDSVMFETNGNVQSVVLEAWGQNANYFPSRWHKDSTLTFTCQGEIVWDDPKPYVLYGWVGFVDCTLTIPAGARIHVHGGLSKQNPTPDSTVIYNSGLLYIGENARLQVLGTLDKPVIIQGDRLEEDFQNVAGQWYGIYLAPGSRPHRLEFAVVKNSLFGVYADSSTQLSLKNVQIANTGGVGLLGVHASVTAENCLFYNNGNHCVQLVYGGDYQFQYCTLANFGTDAPALSLSNGLCANPPFCNAALDVYRLNASLQNCIVYGSKRDEIALNDYDEPARFNYSLSHCIVRVQELLSTNTGYPDFFEHCKPCINARPSDSLFANVNEDDYHLDTLSIAEEMALPLLGILIDLEGTERDALKPDIGCYEYKPK